MGASSIRTKTPLSYLGILVQFVNSLNYCDWHPMIRATKRARSLAAITGSANRDGCRNGKEDLHLYNSRSRIMIPELGFGWLCRELRNSSRSFGSVFSS